MLSKRYFVIYLLLILFIASALALTNPSTGIEYTPNISVNELYPEPICHNEATGINYSAEISLHNTGCEENKYGIKYSAKIGVDPETGRNSPKISIIPPECPDMGTDSLFNCAVGTKKPSCQITSTPEDKYTGNSQELELVYTNFDTTPATANVVCGSSLSNGTIICDSGKCNLSCGPYSYAGTYSIKVSDLTDGLKKADSQEVSFEVIPQPAKQITPPPQPTPETELKKPFSWKCAEKDFPGPGGFLDFNTNFVSMQSTETSEAPDFVMDDEYIYLVWQDETDLEGAGTDYDIFFKLIPLASEKYFEQSFWEELPTYVVSTESNEKSIEPSIAINNSHVFITWTDLTPLDGVSKDRDIFFKYAPVSELLKNNHNVWAKRTTHLVSTESDMPNVKESDVVANNENVFVTFVDNTNYDHKAYPQGNFIMLVFKYLPIDSIDDSDIFTWNKAKTQIVDQDSTSVHNPAMAIDEENLYITWSAYHSGIPEAKPISILFTYSPLSEINNNDSWSGFYPFLVSSPNKKSNNRAPAIAVDDEAVFVAWTSRERVLGYSGTSIFLKYLKKKDLQRFERRDGSRKNAKTIAATKARNKTLPVSKRTKIWPPQPPLPSSKYKSPWADCNTHLIDTEPTGNSVNPSITIENKKIYLAWNDTSRDYAGSQSDRDIFFKSLCMGDLDYNGTKWPDQNTWVISTESGRGYKQTPKINMKNGILYSFWVDGSEFAGKDPDIVFKPTIPFPISPNRLPEAEVIYPSEKNLAISEYNAPEKKIRISFTASDPDLNSESIAEGKTLLAEVYYSKDKANTETQIAEELDLVNSGSCTLPTFAQGKANNINCEIEWDAKMVEDGEYYIDILVDDGEEQIIASSEHSFLLDFTSPELKIIKPAEDEPLAEGDFLMQYYGYDETSGIDSYSVKIDNEQWIENSKNLTYFFTETPEGKHTLSVTAIDVAGNRSAPKTIKINISLPAPSSAIAPICGDKLCSEKENPQDCEIDCPPVCGDLFCTHTENPYSCTKDCSVCGDEICSENEDTKTCPEDCGVCGNGLCEPPLENPERCPIDCKSECGDEMCTHSETPKNCEEDCGLCGNEICDETENSDICPDDCRPVCGDRLCSKGETPVSCPKDCKPTCGNSVCDEMENPYNCPIDCRVVCGDNICEEGEPETCPEDCEGYCGDEICAGPETFINCPKDCMQICECENLCGDGICSNEETFEICPEDCDKHCGDKVCATTEDYETCPKDCGYCGDQLCQEALDETQETCSKDCGVCGDGLCTNKENILSCPEDCRGECGDTICGDAENSVSCPADCPPACGDRGCTHDETSVSCPIDCKEECGDGVCGAEETAVSCPEDCILFCGDGVCDKDEEPETCPEDCSPECGNNFCEEDETAFNCPKDCGTVCGDEICILGENVSNCPQDCPPVCGDGKCTHNETPRICKEDCGCTLNLDCDKGQACKQGICTTPGDPNNNKEFDCGDFTCVAMAVAGQEEYVIKFCPRIMAADFDDDGLITNSDFKKMDRMLLEEGKDCRCGNGICAANETEETCPDDCDDYYEENPEDPIPSIIEEFDYPFDPIIIKELTRNFETIREVTTTEETLPDRTLITTTTVDVTVSNIGQLPYTGLRLVENVPKKYAPNANYIRKRNRNFDVINPDPILQFNIPDLEPGEEFSYSYVAEISETPPEAGAPQPAPPAEPDEPEPSPPAPTPPEPGPEEPFPEIIVLPKETEGHDVAKLKDACKGKGCVDQNPCTADTCVLGSCYHTQLPDGTECGTNKFCKAGRCISPVALQAPSIIEDIFYLLYSVLSTIGGDALEEAPLLLLLLIILAITAAVSAYKYLRTLFPKGILTSRQRNLMNASRLSVALIQFLMPFVVNRLLGIEIAIAFAVLEIASSLLINYYKKRKQAKKAINVKKVTR